MPTKTRNRTTAGNILFVSGVQGAGKSSVARRLSQQLGWVMIEADDHHTAAARQHMSLGHGVHTLATGYREMWLQRVFGACRHETLRSGNVVAACSLLTRQMRALAGEFAQSFSLSATVVWLDVPEKILRERLVARRNHFAPVAMLQAQLETMEAPSTSEPTCVVVIDGDAELDLLTHRVSQALMRSTG